jgi:hypothetical protein
MTLKKETYNIIEDFKGELYCGITLKGNYMKQWVDTSMAQYVMKQLVKYGHVAPTKPQHCPYLPNAIQYKKDNQAPMPSDDSALLDKASKKHIQQIVGSFLFYAQVVDSTIVMALSDLSSQQSAPTKNTMKQVSQFLDYMRTRPDAII